MRKFDFEEAAKTAMREGLPIRILDDYIPTRSISIKMIPSQISKSFCGSVEKISNRYWEQLYPTDFLTALFSLLSSYGIQMDL